jgi:hypothetical protein
MSFLKINKSKIAASGSGQSSSTTWTDASASFTTTTKADDLLVVAGTNFTVVSVDSDTTLTLSGSPGIPSPTAYEIFSEGQKYLFAYQANTGGGEIRFIYSDDVNSGYLNINTNLTSDAKAELYIQSINDAIGSLSNGVVIGPTNVVTVEAPAGAIITGFSFN